jgi:hypothetical protein
MGSGGAGCVHLQKYVFLEELFSDVFGKNSK